LCLSRALLNWAKLVKQPILETVRRTPRGKRSWRMSWKGIK
jgi:hypothetical protein